ncbi:MAG: hypothetical protein ACFFD4_16575 [Candidatus Odinarchaeota archaeon]
MAGTEQLQNLDALIMLSIETLNSKSTVESSVTKIARVSDISVGAVSYRTRNLEAKKLVIRAEEGNKMTHYLTEAGKLSLQAWKETQMGQLLADKYLEKISDNIK